MKKLLLPAFLFLMAFSAQAENPRYKISVTHGGTPLGDIVIELYADAAPKHTNRFDSLVKVGYYNTSEFHRVIPDFMIQGGAGSGALTKVPAEFSSTLKHTRGIVSAARTNDPNSFTSQFFICVATKPHLDGQYSIFGEVLSGMDVADKIVSVPRDLNDRPLKKVQMMVEKLSATGIQDSTEKNSSVVSISPNPANTQTKISFELLKEENIKLEITNNLGEKVKVLHEGNLPKGPHAFTWNTAGMPDGSYLYSFQTSEGIKSGTIVVIKQ